MQISVDWTSFRDRLKIRKTGEERQIFDPVRARWLVLQPEEMVRQLVIQYLLLEKGFPKNRLNVEKELQVQGQKRRLDLIVYSKAVEPYLLVECKRPGVKLDQSVFRQIAWYNMPLRVRYLVVTNGPETYCCEMDYELNSFRFLDALPDFPADADLLPH
ncbi:MAG: type I restriction enzyme HsdR N-terminal domain-containing protein [Lewinellaceae bacterium]|nr:type I restriction enzyme HsdR N-terminal domain-containing protein [Lewinellaceae bacterium]